MKKYVKVIAIAAVLLSGLMLAGCAAAQTIKETVIENVNDSYNKWYKYKSKKQIDIPIASTSASDDEDISKLENAEIYVCFNPDKGLTVSIQSETTQTVELLKGLYQQEMKITVGGNKEYPLEDFGKKSWYTLWGSGKLEKASEPKIHAHPEECVLIGSEKAPGAKIQWKKLLANYLIGSLLED